MRTENKLIKGDCVEVLKSIDEKVKCVYIDPPYNTGRSDFGYNDKRINWLEFMRDRLILLRDILREDGSIWISIDNKEIFNLKPLCDEVFGCDNFISDIIWQRTCVPTSNAKFISNNIDHILVYAKDKSKFKLNLLPRNNTDIYKNRDNDPRGRWMSGNPTAKCREGHRQFEIISPSGKSCVPPANGNRGWRFTKERYEELLADNRIWWGVNGNNSTPAIKIFLSEAKDGIVCKSLWLASEVGSTTHACKESMMLFDKRFSTPKPERLIQRILTLATNKDDLVLDAFIGSGTTTAVAHKMNRRYIGIEISDSFEKYAIPRMKKVIGGEQGGISKDVNWEGGGSFDIEATSLINSNS